MERSVAWIWLDKNQLAREVESEGQAKEVRRMRSSILMKVYQNELHFDEGVPEWRYRGD